MEIHKGYGDLRYGYDITINYESFEHVHSLVTEHDQPFSAYPSTISDGLGDLPGLVKLVTDDAQPLEIKPARRVVVALKPAVKKKLSDLEKLDVLAKVDEPTDWVSQMAVSTKRSGDLRICIDPQVLNKSLKREHFQLPVLEDVLPDLAHYDVKSQSFNPGLQYPHLHGPVHTPDNNRWDTPPV